MSGGTRSGPGSGSGSGSGSGPGPPPSAIQSQHLEAAEGPFRLTLRWATAIFYQWNWNAREVNGWKFQFKKFERNSGYGRKVRENNTPTFTTTLRASYDNWYDSRVPSYLRGEPKVIRLGRASGSFRRGIAWFDSVC